MKGAGGAIGGTPGAITLGVGKIIKTTSPGGTINGNVTLRITGNGQVSYVSGQSRGYPSYAVYAYTVGENGKVQTVFERTRRENKIEDLTKTMTVILRFWCYQRIYVFVSKDRFKINTSIAPLDWDTTKKK
ncbi:MAG: hypothetical protein M3384_20110 [Acidobacteriota bacterium]|nr:hypothetical protein [Acidobacteriota bacterium]